MVEAENFSGHPRRNSMGLSLVQLVCFKHDLTQEIAEYLPKYY
jgi:hypothetical protein